MTTPYSCPSLTKNKSERAMRYMQTARQYPLPLPIPHEYTRTTGGDQCRYIKVFLFFFFASLSLCNPNDRESRRRPREQGKISATTVEPAIDLERCDNRVDGYRHGIESSTIPRFGVFRRGFHHDRGHGHGPDLHHVLGGRGSLLGHVLSSLLHGRHAVGCAGLGGIHRSLP
ncbi:hypothetical protein K449DRAFT_220593 [Hypoxylon sp. EC38]|nr:hypothetical protein K449DRAFT_220593 [Hypoxylon sp. EC38]